MSSSGNRGLLGAAENTGSKTESQSKLSPESGAFEVRCQTESRGEGGPGPGPGLDMTESEMACTVVRSIVDIGDMGGAENATIGVNQMPAHTHVITASP